MRLSARLVLGLCVMLAACTSADEPTAVATTATPSTVATTTAPSTTATTAAPTTEPPAACTVGVVPADAGLDPFYTQGCDLDGFWVVAADVVDPAAIETAAAMVDAFFQNDPAFADYLRSTGIRLGVVGVDQRTTEMPEWRDLYEAFPGVDWDQRARGLGATEARPLIGAGEENILCLASDRYAGEDILLHEFAHVLDLFGYARIDDLFTAELGLSFVEAANAGTWQDTYANENINEYWAEAVQTYFERNLGNEVADGVHGPIDTRDELRQADPGVTALIERTIGDVELPSSCHD